MLLDMCKVAPCRRGLALGLDAHSMGRRRARYGCAAPRHALSLSLHPNQVSGLRQRLTCWLTMLTFETRCHDLQAQLQAISNGVKCVRASQSMPQLLSLVLALGNVLNAGSARAGAKGFRLEVLRARSPRDRHRARTPRTHARTHAHRTPMPPMSMRLPLPLPKPKPKPKPLPSLCRCCSSWRRPRLGLGLQLRLRLAPNPNPNPNPNPQPPAPPPS